MNEQTVRLHIDEPAFAKLSEYQFFEKPYYALQPNNRVLPYDLIAPLFSDYTLKERFVWMPDGSKATLTKDGHIDFPVGAALIKNFFYKDVELPGGKNLIETRLLVRREKGWDPLTYIWNDEQSDADLSIVGDLVEVSASDDRGKNFTIDYLVPNKNQCKGCHERNRTITTIGPKLKNLNRDYLYSDGLKNQLQKWTEIGYLTGYDSLRDTIKFSAINNKNASIGDRALAYLEVNCGTCHHQEGPAYVSGLYLHSKEKNPFNLGICKAPVSAGKGSGGLKFDIVPGHPEQSILVYRMETREPGAMMPELGRKLVHQEGVQLIKDWISDMQGTCP